MEYTLLIVKENGLVQAELQENSTGRRIDFDIDTVIGDYIGIRQKQKNGNVGRPQISYALDSHIFGGLFGCPLEPYNVDWLAFRRENVKQSFRFLKRAKELLNNGERINSKKFQEFCQLSNQFGSKMHREITYCDARGEAVISYNSAVKDFKVLKDEDTWFSYICYSALDMVVAVMEYYLLNEYKLVRCHHCGRYFATQTLKQKYCRRISPYGHEYSQKESQALSCEDAVRRELQLLKHKKNTLLSRIEGCAKSQAGNKGIYLAITDQCAYQWLKTKQNPTPDAFSEFHELLNQIAKEEAWKK